jgi:hypothetical protein
MLKMLRILKSLLAYFYSHLGLFVPTSFYDALGIEMHLPLLASATARRYTGKI